MDVRSVAAKRHAAHVEAYVDRPTGLQHGLGYRWTVLGEREPEIADIEAPKWLNPWALHSESAFEFHISLLHRVVHLHPQRVRPGRRVPGLHVKPELRRGSLATGGMPVELGCHRSEKRKTIGIERSGRNQQVDLSVWIGRESRNLPPCEDPVSDLKRAGDPFRAALGLQEGKVRHPQRSGGGRRRRGLA